MNSILDNLGAASEDVRRALERYTHICSDVQNLCTTSTRMVSSHCAALVNHELKLAESYDLQIQQAKLAIKLARNYAVGIAPISDLPTEILGRIFGLVHDADPSRPDRLAAVCSRWRFVALGLTSLWSLIEYHPYLHGRPNPKSLDRAFLYVSRSGQAPVELKIPMISVLDNTHDDEKTMSDLCLEVAPRTWSLQLDFKGAYNGTSKLPVLTSIFSKCIPGKLTKLSTTYDSFGFLASRIESFKGLASRTVEPDMKSPDLEALLKPITVLHLTGLFVEWGSSAYHGLVDLRLLAAHRTYDGFNIIHQSQLLNIFKASPQLRTLHLGLRVIRYDGPVVRIPLIDLEVLQIHSGYGSGIFMYVEDVLELIETDSKPLHVSIRHHKDRKHEIDEVTRAKAFFSRSNVTKLYVSQLPRLLELVPSLPHLKVLVLADRSWLNLYIPSLSPSRPGTESPLISPQLEMCFILNCGLPLDSFLLLMESFPIQSLTLFKAKFYRDRVLVNMEVALKELSNICPDIRVTNSRPDLAEHCDLLPEH